jgi:hypothetical protein
MVNKIVSPTGAAKLWDAIDVPSNPFVVIQLVETQALTTEKPTITDQKTADLFDRIEVALRASTTKAVPIIIPTAEAGRPLMLLMRWAMPCGSLAGARGGKSKMRTQAPGPDMVA